MVEKEQRGILVDAAAKAGLSKAEFNSVRDWLAAQLDANQYAKLGQGGHTIGDVPLTQVFVDLPVSASPDGDTHQERQYFLSNVNAPSSSRKLLNDDAIERQLLCNTKLLVGGPGQGKSTLAQITSQLHRVALLNPVLAELTTDQQALARSFAVKLAEDNTTFPLPANTAYLVPLNQKQALGYAEKLIENRHKDATERQRQMQRMQLAAKESATARLLTSPLQITILTSLLEKIGRAPRERWALFHRYFSHSYDREIARHTYASSLLRDHRIYVEQIHQRVGLLLQVETEQSGGAAARITRERLRDITKHTSIVESRIKSKARQFNANWNNPDIIRELFQSACDMLLPGWNYIALHYDALRHYIPNARLQACIGQSWPEPGQIGAYAK